MRQPDSNSMLVRFWGVRGSIPTPGPATVKFGGNTACVEVRAGGEIIILDAGTGIRPLGLALEREFGSKPIQATLLLSHSHWDHIQGLPFFGPAYKDGNNIRVLGYEGAREGLSAILAGQMESPYFPVPMRRMQAQVAIEELREMEFAIGKVRVRACLLNHPGTAAGYRLEFGHTSMAYLTDNETFPAHGPAAGVGAPSSASREGLVEFLKDVDALVIDTQYDDSEFAERRGWGHGCVTDVVDLAVDAGAKRLFLFHHDPEHDDAFVESMVQCAQDQIAAKRANVVVEGAREGREFLIGG